MFEQQRAHFLKWYNEWSDIHVTSNMKQMCESWFLGTTDSPDHPLTERTIEEFNGQKRARYTTD